MRWRRLRSGGLMKMRLRGNRKQLKTNRRVRKNLVVRRPVVMMAGGVIWTLLHSYFRDWDLFSHRSVWKETRQTKQRLTMRICKRLLNLLCRELLRTEAD